MVQYPGFTTPARECRRSWDTEGNAAIGSSASQLRGFLARHHPFGSPSAGRALSNAGRLGASAIAMVPFLWQPSPSASDLVAGSDMSDDALRAGIRGARGLGFAVIVKPHVWVPDNCAVRSSQPLWFVRYGAELERIARIAGEEGADALCHRHQLAKTSSRPLLHVAHNIRAGGGDWVWPMLDVIGVELESR